MITGFCHIYLPVKNIDETIAFYTERLGFSEFRRWSMGPGRDAAYLRLGDILLELSVPAQGGALPAETGRIEARFGLTVDHLDETLDELRRQGVEVLPEGATPPRSFSGRQVRIKDPSGWQIALREWRAPDGPHYTGWQPQEQSTATPG